MDGMTDASAKCELRSYIPCFQTKENSAAEIHQKMNQMYRENFLSDVSVRGCCRKFRDGETKVWDEGGYKSKSVATEDVVQRVY